MQHNTKFFLINFKELLKLTKHFLQSNAEYLKCKTNVMSSVKSGSLQGIQLSMEIVTEKKHSLKKTSELITVKSKCKRTESAVKQTNSTEEKFDSQGNVISPPQLRFLSPKL